jgi:hypothetical protein
MAANTTGDDLATILCMLEDLMHFVCTRIDKQQTPSSTGSRNDELTIGDESMMGKCVGCGSTGLQGNFCIKCEDTGFIYEKEINGTSNTRSQQSNRRATPQRATPRNTTNTTNTTIERDSLGYLIFKVGDKVRFERDKKFPYPGTGKRDKYKGQTGQVTWVTESYVHVQLHHPTRIESNVKRRKMSVVHASM